MSDATLRAVHEALAAHVADVNDGEILLVTDWHATVAAAIANDPHTTMYCNIGSDSPYHNRLGLAHRGLELLTEPPETD